MSDDDSKPKKVAEISKAPEPLTPLRNSGYRGGSLIKKIRTDAAPNWDYWSQRQQAELWTAIALCCDLEPRNSEFGELVSESARRQAPYDGDKYKQAFERLEIAIDRFNEFSSIHEIASQFTKINLPRFAAWAHRMNWHMPDAFVSMASAADSKEEAKGEATKAQTPDDRAHISDKLAMMNQAARKFWANANRDDRGTHPSNATVTSWLVQQGFTQTLAEKAATLIRPEWVPTGRKPEE